MASRKRAKGERKTDRMPRRLFKRGRTMAIPPGRKVLYEPAGHEKMSVVLERFVEPYRDEAETDDSVRNLFNLGMLAWNAALMPESEGRATIDMAIEAGFKRSSGADRATAKEFVEALVQRKREHFASNQRAIVSFELTDTGDGYHLSVMSTL